MRQDIEGERVVLMAVDDFPIIYPADDPRRYFAIVKADTTYYAWWLRRWKGSDGVGAPGHWDLDGVTVKWRVDEQDAKPRGASLQVVPLPVRDLLDNEVVAAGFGGLSVIRRTDLWQDPLFTPADRKVLLRILKLLEGLSAQ